MAYLPMFPLGAVLFPGTVLPLHIFEPRYLAMLGYCLDHEPEFGVVLITRGQETGGGDQRAAVATVSRIIDLQSHPDGRCALRTVGTRRVRVTAWFPDDPYPQAEVEDFPDETSSIVAPADPDAVVARLRRLLAAMAEHGAPVADPYVELSSDPVMASYQAAALAPVDTHDQYRLLSVSGPPQRWQLLDGMLDEQSDIFRFTHGGEAI